MKIIFLLSLLLILLFSNNSNSQITFLGFEQPECITYSDFGYTYQNLDGCVWNGNGYKIFHDGSEVFYKCESFSSDSVEELRFTHMNMGFLHENGDMGNAIYKTTNSGTSWTYMGGGPPTFQGWLMINENTGYLVTSWTSPIMVAIARVSDIELKYLTDGSNPIQDTIIHDTIYGEDLCDYDTLRFNIVYSEDTLLYQIVLHYIPLESKELNADNQFTVFPNPVSDYLEFPSEFFTDDFTVKIYDCNFRLVSEFHNPKSSVYFGNLDSGFYFVEFKDSENRWVRKVIRQ